LTERQYINSVRDILGDAAATVAESLDTDEPIALGDHRFRSMRAAVTGFVDLAVERLNGTAFDVARTALADTTRRTQLLGCTPTAADDACVKGFFGRVGRRLFRRPLAVDEVARYTAAAATVARTEGNDAWKGIEAALAGMVQAPSFLYRVDVGEADAQVPGRVRFTGYEMAGRLALLLWDSAPDDALLDAAERRELVTAAGVSTQAQRMLVDARAARGVGAFASDMFEADRLSATAKDATAYPQFTPLLVAAMRDEMERTIADLVLAQDADVLDMYTTKSTFVNDALAKLYGVSGITGSDLRKVALPAGPRAGAGVLGFAGLLAVNAGALEASPILRGVFLNERLLCRDFGQPPPEAANVTVQTDATGAKRTLRQRVEATTKPPNCAACHDRINPLGFGLETFDAVGAVRKNDNGLAIDASGTLDGAPFDGPAGLAKAIRDSEAAAGCMTRQLYRYATGHVEDRGEEPTLVAMDKQFRAAGRRGRSLFLDFVSGDGFRHARAN
jgi:hypothetical protein